MTPNAGRQILRALPGDLSCTSKSVRNAARLRAGSAIVSELLSSPKLARLIEELKCRYENRIVLFDLPSVLASEDAEAFCPFVDCALLVVEEGKTRVEDVRRALDHLKATKILGAVLNRSIHVDNDGKTIWR